MRGFLVVAATIAALACGRSTLDGSWRPRSAYVACAPPRAHRTCTHLSEAIPPGIIAGIDLNGVNDGSLFGQAIERSDGLYFSLIHDGNNGQPEVLAALTTNGTSLSFAPLVPLAAGDGVLATDGSMLGQLSILDGTQIQLNAFDVAFATTANETLSMNAGGPRLAARSGLPFRAARFGWQRSCRSERWRLRHPGVR